MTDPQVMPRLPFAEGGVYAIPQGHHDGAILPGPPLPGTDVMGLFSYFTPDIDSMLYEDYVGS